MRSEEKFYKLIVELKKADPRVLEEALEELGPEKFLIKYLIETISDGTIPV